MYPSVHSGGSPPRAWVFPRSRQFYNNFRDAVVLDARHDLVKRSALDDQNVQVLRRRGLPVFFPVHVYGIFIDMRIGVDARVLAESAPMGVARCTAALLGTSAKLAPEHEYYLYVRQTPIGWGPFSAPPFHQRVLVGNRLLNSPLVWQQVYFPWIARRDGVDVLVSPYYCGPLLSPAPQVVVVHDISFSRFPQDFPSWIRFKPKLLARPSSRQAACVVTVSEFSRQEILSTYGLAADKVVVVYHGCEDAFWQHKTVPEQDVVLDAVLSGAGFRQEPFFLFVGSLLPRRQVYLVIRALAQLAPRYHLLVVGESDAEKCAAVQASAQDCDIADRVHCLGHVADAVLETLYQRALALVSPSTYEGFGLPILEAMKRGLPVVAWDIPIVREIAGNAAVLIASGDVSGLAGALDRIGADAEWRKTLSAAGHTRAKRFSWRQSAQAFLKVLHTVVQT